MRANHLIAPDAPPVSTVATVATTLREKLLTILVAPGDVFEEVVGSPPNPACWLAPTLLVCAAAMISLWVGPVGEWRAAEVRHLAEAGAIAAPEAARLSGRLGLAALTIAAAAVAGTFWSAFVLWFIGRVFLKARVPYLKAVEIVGLTGVILALGAVVTALLIAATGDASARADLSLFLGPSAAAGKVRLAAEALNFFHLWTATVLAIGLSKLAGVSFREAAFWVLGYWVGLRAALIWLA